MPSEDDVERTMALHATPTINWPVQPSPTPAEVLKEAKRRYLFDALFHARADLAASILGTLTPQQRLDAHDASLARHAASVALILAEMP